MIKVRIVLTALVCAALAAGCASAAAPSPAAQSRAADPSAAPTAAAEPTDVADPSNEIRTLPAEFAPLAAGTYRLARGSVSEDGEFPPILISVPAGWEGSRRFVRILRPDEEIGRVAVQFWDVDQVYGHPCPSRGTLFQPGPSVNDLASALVDVPLRHATQPTDVTVDGYIGKSLEWSVPADIDFADCDPESDEDYFDSWTDTDGGGRYQQGPGQVDRLWILDIDGARLVIDAFWMPSATSDEREQLLDVVESIRFER
jgi:hypothetical protein